MPMKDSIQTDAWLQQAVGGNPLYEIKNEDGSPTGHFNSGPCRLRFVYIGTPRENSQDPTKKPKYQATILLTPFTDTRPMLDAGTRIICTKKGWQPGQLHPQSISLRSVGGIPTPFHDGFEKHDKPGYTTNTLFLNLSSDRKPLLRCQNGGQFVELADHTKFYDGCWAIVQFNLYMIQARPNIPERLCAGLVSLLLYGDDTALGGASVAPERAFAGVVGAAPMVVPRMDINGMPQGGPIQTYVQNPQGQYQPPQGGYAPPPAAQHYGAPPMASQGNYNPPYQPQPQYQPPQQQPTGPRHPDGRLMTPDEIAYMQRLGLRV